MLYYYRILLARQPPAEAWVTSHPNIKLPGWTLRAKSNKKVKNKKILGKNISCYRLRQAAKNINLTYSSKNQKNDLEIHKTVMNALVER